MKIGLFLSLMLTSISAFPDLSQYARTDPRLNVDPILRSYKEISGFEAQADRWDREFKATYGVEWDIRIDLRGGKVGGARGAGIPVFPGIGNNLPFDHETTEGDVRKIAVGFLSANAKLFGFLTEEIGISSVTPVDDFWHVHFSRSYNGVPVYGSMFSLAISHGNIVGVSTRHYGNVAVNTVPSLSSDAATAAMFQYIGGRDQEKDSILKPGRLFILPIAVNGLDALSYTGGLGNGYGHLLAWKISFSREGEGAWEAFVDAHSGQVLEFHDLSFSAQAHSSVQGKIFYYPTPGQPRDVKTVGMPYADIRTDNHDCYRRDNKRCLNKPEPDDCLPEDPDQNCSLYGRTGCTDNGGNFCYDPAALETPYTRLVSPYINIRQDHSQNLMGSPDCECGVNQISSQTYMCVRMDATKGIIAMDGEFGTSGDYYDLYEDECKYHDIDSNVAEDVYPWNVPGNNLAARTAYWHGVNIKMSWANALRSHQQPAESPCGVCPQPEGTGLLRWLTSPLWLHINAYGQEDHYSEGEQSIFLSRWVVNYNVNSGEIPGTLFHEFGHSIDCHDGYPYFGPGETNCELRKFTSSEGYADIVSALMSKDSCIARGWWMGEATSGRKCQADFYDFNGLDNGCKGCYGYRDINYLDHKQELRYKLINLFAGQICPSMANCDTGSDQCGPCGYDEYCEASIATQAFWEFVELLKVRYQDEEQAFQIAERLFKRAVFNLDTKHYSCTANDSCQDGHLFIELWQADDIAGDGMPPPHRDELCQAFQNHEIACNLSSYCGTIQQAQTCPSIAKPVLPLTQVYEANNTVFMDWGAAAGAFGYDVMRSDLGPLASYIRVGAVSQTEFMDTGLLNGQTYWYRIVPTGASRSCIGPLSDARQATPLAGKLLIFPQMQATWLLNSYQTRKLEAYGGSGDYAWSIISGSLPVGSGLALNTVTGELYGAPIKKPLFDPPYYYTFIVQATDQETGGPLGTQQYTIKVDITAADLDFTPTFMPAARVCFAYPYCYNVPLSPTAGPAISGFNFSLKSGAGGLPPGLNLIKESGNWYIRGIPRSSGLGLHRFTIVLTATGPNNIQLMMERAFEMPVFTGEAKEMLVSQAEGPSSGGTRLRLYMNVLAISYNLGAFFDLKNDACTATSGVSLAAEDFQVFYTDAAHNCYMEIITPRAIEGCYDVRVRSLSNNVDLGKADNGYRFKTLAFTADQVGHSVSVIDTQENKPFAGRARINLDPAMVPMNIAFNRGNQKDGRILYIVDYLSGNLSVFDAANQIQLGEVVLQDPMRPKPGPGAFDIAVSSDGSHAFVAHISDGLKETLNPHPGGVSVLTLDSDGYPTLYDVDCNPLTTTGGAPEGYTRIDTLDAYPLSMQTVMITQDQGAYAYQEGEKWPGEYIFLSVVGAAQEHLECPPGGPCQIEIEPRKAYVVYIDNNQKLYCDPAAHSEANYCDTHWFDYINPDYWETSHTVFLPDPRVTPAQDGVDLGETSQGIGFTLTSGDPALGPTVYMLNELESRMYMFHYVQDGAASHWAGVFRNGTLDYVPIPTGQRPTDIKVQGTAFMGGPVRYLAYITNAGDDTLTVLDTTTNAALPYPLSPLSLDACSGGDHYPTSFDARQDGTFGYTANFHSASVSVFNLEANQCQTIAPAGVIPVGQYPIQIAVQPSIDTQGLFSSVRNAMIFAEPVAFITPSKQPILVKEWDHTLELQGTAANSQAVLTHINNFQRNIDQWVADPPLQNDLNKAVDLYRSAYMLAHPETTE